MVKRLATHFGGLDKDFQIGARCRLPDKIVKRLRAQRIVFVYASVSINERVAVAHAILLA